MLGVISNSVGRVDAVTSAVELCTVSGAAFVAHCGDVGGRHILDALGGIDSAFVWGDRDNDRMGLMRYAHSIGIRCFGLLGELEHSGKRIMMVHGDDRRLLRRIIEEQEFDYVLCGHDLSVEDRMVGKTRVLNPGALHGGNGASAMLLDVESGKITILNL